MELLVPNSSDFQDCGDRALNKVGALLSVGLAREAGPALI